MKQLLTILLLTIAIGGFSQGMGSPPQLPAAPGGLPPRPCWPPPCIPIDGGIVFLVLGAIGYGGYKAKQHGQKK